MNYSVVDLGTNSARLMVAREDGGRIKPLFKTLRTIRIGEGMTLNKSISFAAMERTKHTLTEFMRISREHASAHFFCFATSAVREAENRSDFLEYIKRECGVEIDVISGDTEAYLGFAGSVGDTGGMFDIGGGSTEVVFGSDGDIKFKKSYNIGTVKCLQMFPDGDEADPAAFEKAHRLAEETFRAMPDASGYVFTGIGGTATALASVDLGLKEYDAARIQGHVITFQKAQELCRMLESKTKEQRKSIIGLEENRADVIVLGAIIMLEFMKKITAKEVVVSDRDNQEGYLAMKLGLL